MIWMHPQTPTTIRRSDGARCSRILHFLPSLALVKSWKLRPLPRFLRRTIRPSFTSPFHLLTLTDQEQADYLSLSLSEELPVFESVRQAKRIRGEAAPDLAELDRALLA